MTAASVITRLLVDLGFVLWQQQVLQWQRDGKAWTSEEKLVGAIGYFLKGLHVGETPVFDGMCAYCGSLLYGPLNESGVSNKTNGRPVTLEGTLVMGARPENAQPPFSATLVTRPLCADGARCVHVRTENEPCRPAGVPRRAADLAEWFLFYRSCYLTICLMLSDIEC